MTTLNQLLAIDKGVGGRAHRSLTDAYQAIQRQPIFHGLTKTYQPKDDDGDPLPGESTRVQQSVAGLVASIKGPLGAQYDVTLEKDTTNTYAKADVEIDGELIISQAPVTYLLWLEKRLIDLHTFAEKWPTLDPAESWDYDSMNGVYRTPVTETFRTQKARRSTVVVPPTDKHPAQVDIYNVDEIAGYWKLIKFSGATEPTKKQAVLDRIEVLLAAVRQAREAANAILVAEVDKRGQAILDYIFEPVTT